MFIKQVIIQGFKSYREQTVVDPFDPRHNVVVGRNGSGKSNFFCAIQFVLSNPDEFSHLKREQRQALLHEGPGPCVTSAHVEIIFDNCDRRLLRMISCEKDQYFLNNQIATRNDVMNLLELAGFSRSNPYYIVKQGKINQMATAPDSHRLKLLREVAGTKIYDDKKQESKSILKETEGKIEKINDSLLTMEKRLKRLEEEKEELKEYQRWDKQRRCLEYTIYERELKENKRKLVEFEVLRTNSGAEQARLGAELKTVQETVGAATKRLKEAKKEVQIAKEEREILGAEQQQLLKEKNKLTFTINDLLEEVKGDNDSKKRAQQELEKLEANIALREDELKSLKPEYEGIKRVEEERMQELELKEQKCKELYAKQDRGSQFTTKDERDKWIQNELKQLTKQIKDKEEYQKKISEDLKCDTEKQIALEKKVGDHTREIEQQRASIEDHNKRYYELLKLKDQYQVTRKEQYRQESVLQLNLSDLKEDLAKADQSLRSTTGVAILNGKDSVRKVLDTFRKREDMISEVSSYYGPVIESFSCDESVYMAVEVTAGNRLFYHIVETDKFGTQILKEMNSQLLSGEVTFIPLNRLRVKAEDYPQVCDAIPMISKLSYDPKFDKALRNIFGNTLICRNLETATTLARDCGFDCVTLGGDQVSSKGTLTGGYFNTRRSRLEIQKTRSKLISQISALEIQLTTLREEIRKTDQSISSYVNEMQRTETRRSKAKDIYDKIKADIRLMKEELSAIEMYRAPKEISLAQCTSSLEAMSVTKYGLESELRQELTALLSVADKHQVDTLKDNIKRLTKESKEAFEKRMQLEIEKNKLENLLTSNLMRRKDDLVQVLQEISIDDRQRQLESSKIQLADIEKRLMEVNEDFGAQNEKVANAMKKQKLESDEVEKWKSKEKEAREKILDAKDLEKLTSKLNILQQKIVECKQKITELGVLSSREAYFRFTTISTQQLFKEMKQANKHLKKYSHVNKKALDQFISFSNQIKELVKRKEELDRNGEKIKQLLLVLEQRKCEAVQFTFKQMSKSFSEVFKKLVPSGHAQLVMKTRNGDEKEGGTVELSDSDEFVGVGIRVSFARHTSEMREINQLSGGQKSLVALSLMFAIQKCDPAPFYLFDEIDHMLDPQDRQAVANMIHELSSHAQFITTTFRPELLHGANKFYGVKFRNKISHIECVMRQEAADFVEDDSMHD
ncbi:PREDICTED: structural maintenance of chromosomes protein 3-like isoform X2 [Vollenhovia emeryi]|uniref:structural maintenance of chromosomes protein 3-like isoform X2 n=1 Tax=Vollenhovia emeryi TaxID=411798 RepID=UPI0005F5698A|nr:PREDICTED: structural maintenance of chromosomes protein 3-like isoform X2 [Vollenhovia emeryi]